MGQRRGQSPLLKEEIAQVISDSGRLVTLKRVSLRYGDYFPQLSSELQLQEVVAERLSFL